jgi:hypothetical protein
MSKSDYSSVSGGTHTNHVLPQLPERERKLTVYEVVRERFDVWSEIISACDVEAKRMILSTMYINDGVCRYKDLFDTVARSERVIKKHIYHLEESNIVEKGGNPAFVSFKDTDVALLVSDALSNTDDI